MTTHTCEIKISKGVRTRIVAIREHKRELHADYAIRVIQQVPGRLPAVAVEFTSNDFPRAYGVDGLFGSVLVALSATDYVARDEAGEIVPLPEGVRKLAEVI